MADKRKPPLKKPLVAGVLDYDMGNLRSVAKALEAAGAEVFLSRSIRELERSDVLVLPGQGSFGAAMRVLKSQKLVDFVRGWISSGRPYLGICLGLQLLFEKSEEAPGVEGLKVLKGTVKKFKAGSKNLKIPHIGWNKVVWDRGGDAPRGGYFYFVHSYYPVPRGEKVRAAKTRYGGAFCSGVARTNLVATQFHPEKSGRNGIHFLRSALQKFSVPAC